MDGLEGDPREWSGKLLRAWRAKRGPTMLLAGWLCLSGQMGIEGVREEWGSSDGWIPEWTVQ